MLFQTIALKVDIFKDCPLRLKVSSLIRDRIEGDLESALAFQKSSAKAIIQALEHTFKIII